MRQLPYWALLASAFVALLVVVYLLMFCQEPEKKPERNAYYPFTVELSVRDR